MLQKNTLCFRNWLFLSTIFFFISITSQAQNGTIKGTLMDSTTNESLPGAIISSPEYPTLGAQSDMEGNILMVNVKPGTYNFIIAYIGYKTIELKGIEVKAGQTVDLGTIHLVTDQEVETIVIYGEVATNTEEAVFEEIRNSDNVVSGISNEQIRKGQDKDAAQALQRVPGVSILDGRFIMIRGLNDRYNSVWLNNGPAPSSETDRKAFSFDVLPTGVLDRMLVYKTPSADLPGDFAGGFVKVYTITPKERIFNVNATLGYRTGTTFKDFNRDKSPTDWMGFDSGQRALPKDLPVITSANGYTNTQLNDYSQSFNNNWGYKTIKALPDGRLSVVYSNSKALKNDSKLGMLATLNYTNTNTTFNIIRTDADGAGVKTQTRNDEQN
ncbi:MAG: TonB-dependent receptor plug domain-containing protein, partial [Cytophagales bacterium]|nr:TonB-dependent receptor plug domain-containing protein [Cytophaga sp.]